MICLKKVCSKPWLHFETLLSPNLYIILVDGVHTTQLVQVYLTRITIKQTLRSLSLSYQKKDGRTWPILLLAWHRLLENIIYVSRVKFWKAGLKSRCHTIRRMGTALRAHPSVGMTTTKTLRSVFSWRASLVYCSVFLHLPARLVRGRFGPEVACPTDVMGSSKAKSDILKSGTLGDAVAEWIDALWRW